MGDQGVGWRRAQYLPRVRTSWTRLLARSSRTNASLRSDIGRKPNAVIEGERLTGTIEFRAYG